MNKLEFILKFGRFYKDPLGNIGCSDEHIWGHYHKEITVGKTKEEAAKEMVTLYDAAYKNGDSYLKKQLWTIGWSDGDSLELSNEKLKSIYLSIISESDWLNSQDYLAPIGREYLFKEFLPSASWAQFYKKFFNKVPSSYQEMFSDIRDLKEDISFEFYNYTKTDCIREGFFQVFSQKNLDELKLVIQQIKQQS